MSSYVTDEQLKLFAVANEADDTAVWELLSEGVSRLFDRECEVADGFFDKTSNTVSLRSYRGNGTRYLQLFPYIPASITIIDVDGTDYYEAVAANREYREKDGFLIFDADITIDTPIDVTAKYGFSAIPVDVQLACIEQGLSMWRRKDMSFAEISGVSAAAINAEFSPSFVATTKRYREIYTGNNYFA